MKDVYRGGEIAKIFAVAPRTVSGWIDTGMLKGYRLPGSLDRRVVHGELVKFALKYDLPMGWAHGGSPVQARPVSESRANIQNFCDAKEYDCELLQYDCSVLLNVSAILSSSSGQTGDA